MHSRSIVLRCACWAVVAVLVAVPLLHTVCAHPCCEAQASGCCAAAAPGAEAASTLRLTAGDHSQRSLSPAPERAWMPIPLRALSAPLLRDAGRSAASDPPALAVLRI